ncbi:Imm59 family immunity protein [Listeria aquatica]|uniref:Imm59 family immunity protein n=1 Tax=Listeria aquatica TaxID=1494960 RepID=UPI0031F57FC3
MTNQQLKDFKKEIEQEINQKNYQTLRYVLFDEDSKVPFAVHLYVKDDKFMVNSRDDRSYVIGKTFEFTTFEEAKKKFFHILKLTVEINKEDAKLGYVTEYPSPLWDKDKAK